MDLGCSPGSWLQYVACKVGENGRVLGVDLKSVKLSIPKNVKVVQANIFNIKMEDLLMNEEKIDVILSDMAPKTTGIRHADAQRSFDLNKYVLELSNKILFPGGSLLVKAFQGPQMRLLHDEFKNSYANVRICKPKSSRSESIEIFILGLKKK